MPPATSRDETIEAPIRLLHLWRVALLCIALAHEREHPALAVLLLVPVNHLFFNLTTGLDRAASGVRTKRAGWVVGLYLLATLALVRSYGSPAALIADLRALSRAWEWWALVLAVSVLALLYRPIGAVLRRFVGATGLEDPRLWSGLAVAIGVRPVPCGDVWSGESLFAAAGPFPRRPVLQHRDALDRGLRRHRTGVGPGPDDGVAGDRDQLRAARLPAQPGRGRDTPGGSPPAG
jgi:hypothetical protein